jgi:hypothetical protein
MSMTWKDLASPQQKVPSLNDNVDFGFKFANDPFDDTPKSKWEPQEITGPFGMSAGGVGPQPVGAYTDPDNGNITVFNQNKPWQNTANQSPARQMLPEDYQP